MAVPISSRVWIDSPGGRKLSLCPMSLLQQSLRLSSIVGLPISVPPPISRQTAGPNFNLTYPSLYSPVDAVLACHPEAKGMVRRLHRQLMASLRAANCPENWTDHLPWSFWPSTPPPTRIMIVPAERVFGATVLFPGGMISPIPRDSIVDPANLLHRLQQLLRKFLLVGGLVASIADRSQ
ncbi:hypothetical protein SprV_0401695600 [Sparganum proliferum]